MKHAFSKCCGSILKTWWYWVTRDFSRSVANDINTLTCKRRWLSNFQKRVVKCSIKVFFVAFSSSFFLGLSLSKTRFLTSSEFSKLTKKIVKFYYSRFKNKYEDEDRDLINIEIHFIQKLPNL